MIDFELPDILQASIGIYCETNVGKIVDKTNEDILFQEKRNFNFYLGNLGRTNEEKLTTAKEILDELAEEICYMTGFGVYNSTLKTYHQKKPVSLLKNEYSQFHPIGGVFLFSLELECGWKKRISLPYAYPKHEQFPPGKVRYGRAYKIHDISIHNSLFQRFLKKFDDNSEGVLYYRKERTYHPYPIPKTLWVSTLPKSRQSIAQRGRQKSQRKLRQLRKKQAKEEALLRKKQGKTPVADKVYLIQMDENIFKIGYSRRPKVRLQGIQTSHPRKLNLIHTFPAESGKIAEDKLHRFFHRHRLEGEWFELDESQKNLVLNITAYEDGRFLSNTDHPQLNALNLL